MHAIVLMVAMAAAQSWWEQPDRTEAIGRMAERAESAAEGAARRAHAASESAEGARRRAELAEEGVKEIADRVQEIDHRVVDAEVDTRSAQAEASSAHQTATASAIAAETAKEQARDAKDLAQKLSEQMKNASPGGMAFFEVYRSSMGWVVGHGGASTGAGTTRGADAPDARTPTWRRDERLATIQNQIRRAVDERDQLLAQARFIAEALVVVESQLDQAKRAAQAAALAKETTRVAGAARPVPKPTPPREPQPSLETLQLIHAELVAHGAYVHDAVGALQREIEDLNAYDLDVRHMIRLLGRFLVGLACALPLIGLAGGIAIARWRGRGAALLKQEMAVMDRPACRQLERELKRYVNSERALFVARWMLLAAAAILATALAGAGCWLFSTGALGDFTGQGIGLDAWKSSVQAYLLQAIVGAGTPVAAIGGLYKLLLDRSDRALTELHAARERLRESHAEKSAPQTTAAASPKVQTTPTPIAQSATLVPPNGNGASAAPPTGS